MELLSYLMTEDDHYYERVVRNTLCVIKCKKDVFGSRVDRNVESIVIDDFQIRKPYDYLQLCYYKVNLQEFYVIAKQLIDSYDLLL